MPEGKYPVVLRRDGTRLEHPYFVLALRDAAAPAALTAYADACDLLELDEHFVADIRRLAEEASQQRSPDCQPDQRPHRPDQPWVLRWWHERWTLQEFLAWRTGRARRLPADDEISRLRRYIGILRDRLAGAERACQKGRQYIEVLEAGCGWWSKDRRRRIA